MIARARDHAHARTRAAVLLLLTLVVATSCRGRTTAPPHAGESTRVTASAVPPSAQPKRSAVVDTILAAIVRHKLASTGVECLSLEREQGATAYATFTVRERHGGTCAGDPATAPRLFSIAVDTVSWSLLTDAHSPAAAMEPLPRTP